MKLKNIILKILLLASIHHAHAVTHMGQLARDHVVLEVISGTNGGCMANGYEFQRTSPDGSINNASVNSQGAFRIPAGKVLVITDVDWQFNDTTGASAAGNIETLRLWIQPLTGGGNGRIAFESTLLLGSKGKNGRSESMKSGFVVSSKARICPDTFPNNGNGVQHLLLRGYLTTP